MSHLLFNAFVMNTASHIQHGQWRHAESCQSEFNDVNLWINLARRLEGGIFDAIFFADVVGLYGPIDGDYSVNVREGLQIPSNDPSVLLSALAVNTEHLGLAFTSSILQEHPFNFARKISTLDHISKGRIAWNIVTSTLENGARNFGFSQLPEHDERYEWAKEYVDVLYKLWEGSWDEGALLKDRARGVFSDPARIHKINHVGKRYRVEGPHLSSPSPQRTPLLFQAGSSGAGRRFAAMNAEAQFIAVPNLTSAESLIRETRHLATEAGRNPQDILFFQAMSFVIGSTEEEARRIEREYEEYASREGFLAHMNYAVDSKGIPYPPETPLSQIRTNAAQSILEWIRKSSADKEPTVADLGDLVSRRTRIVGTPDQIADQLEAWQRAGIDGINVVNWRLPGSYDDFIEHVMPVLRKRGLAKTEYREGTLRAKLFGEDRLNDRHPAARYRGAYSERERRAA